MCRNWVACFDCGLLVAGTILRSMRFEKIWAEQCKATKRIKRSFGAKSALDYLIGEKLTAFAKGLLFAAEAVRERNVPLAE